MVAAVAVCFPDYWSQVGVSFTVSFTFVESDSDSPREATRPVSDIRWIRSYGLEPNRASDCSGLSALLTVFVLTSLHSWPLVHDHLMVSGPLLLTLLLSQLLWGSSLWWTNSLHCGGGVHLRPPCCVCCASWQFSQVTDMADGGQPVAPVPPVPVAPIPPVPGICFVLIIDSHVTENWRLFRQKWGNYSILAQLDRQPAVCQVALLLNALALWTYNGFHFDTPEDRRTVAKILTRFDQFAVGEVNETYERFLFNRRCQNEGETFETFHAAIRTLAKTCNYCNNCVNTILRDRIVIGIRDSDTQTTLLKERNLTLLQAIDICKPAEYTAMQGRALRPDTVHRMAASRPLSRRKQRMPSSIPTPTSEWKERHKERECKFCGNTHPMRKDLCPAWGKKCNVCNKENHYGCKCPSTHRRKVHNVVEAEPESSEEDWINSVHSMGSSQLKCAMLVAGKEVVFQVDTGASVNTLPEKYADHILPTTRTLLMWNNATLKPTGVCRLSLWNPKNRKKNSVEFIVVKDGHTPLLGLNAAAKMGLVQVVDDNVERVASLQLDLITEKFPTMFDEKLGSLPGIVHLRVKEKATPW